MDPGKKIDSHSSFINNKRIIGLLAEVDRLALISGNSLHFSHINAYYNAVEQVYMNTDSLLSDNTKIETTRSKYNKLLDLIDTDARYRSKKTLRLMRRLVQSFNYLLVSELQTKQFFFRLSSIQRKGLKNVKFFDQTIFGSGDLNEKNKTEN